jgi:hypothetical protein
MISVGTNKDLSDLNSWDYHLIQFRATPAANTVKLDFVGGQNLDKYLILYNKGLHVNNSHS